jgi:hypothetical protein
MYGLLFVCSYDVYCFLCFFFLLFRVLLVNLDYVHVAVRYSLCANCVFENNITPCLNKTTIASLPVQLPLLTVCRDIMFPEY